MPRSCPRRISSRWSTRQKWVLLRDLKASKTSTNTSVVYESIFRRYQGESTIRSSKTFEGWACLLQEKILFNLQFHLFDGSIHLKPRKFLNAFNLLRGAFFKGSNLLGSIFGTAYACPPSYKTATNGLAIDAPRAISVISTVILLILYIMPVPFLLADTSGGDGEVIEDIANGYNRLP